MIEHLGRLEDIAEGALYLALSDWVTGSNLVIDGGFTAWQARHQRTGIVASAPARAELPIVI
jgi:hypothetical protein